MLKKIDKYITNPKLVINALSYFYFFNFLSDEKYLKLKYYIYFNKKLDLDNPKTFNEKMQWLKLYNREDIYTTMVDKYEVKKYVSKIIGEEYIIPTIGIYNKFEDIDFENLPDQFVIKCTHDSGGIVICKSKKDLNIAKTKKIINKYLKRKYYCIHREWPYKNVKPRIIIEKYVEDKNNKSMRDYKFFCFNGEAKYCLVCSDRETELKETFFDLNWNKTEFKRPNHDIDLTIEKPKNYDLMIQLANTLSKNILFVRIDFYEINGQVYFGEITFYPASGFTKFEPEEWDYKLGKLINLEKVNIDEK